jgi:NADP-dependent 3-hydroxy acid dehydrogenase YdfG
MDMKSAGMVVVSGAGTGIGRAVARRLTGDGFRVLAVGRRREPLDRPDGGWVTGQVLSPNGGVVLGR